MMCQTARVPRTAASVTQCRIRDRGPARRPKPAGLRQLRRSSTPSAAMEAMTQPSPTAITVSLSVVGLVMKRVSMSMRADRPG